MPRSIFFSPRRCWCLRFHKASLLSPSSSPCPELCWGSVSWGWRVLSGSGRWEIPSMRSSTPSRISLAQSWKEQTHPRAAQQNPSCGNSPAKQLTSPDRWICKVGLSTQQSGLKTALFLWQRQVIFHFPAPSTLSPQQPGQISCSLKKLLNWQGQSKK